MNNEYVAKMVCLICGAKGEGFEIDGNLSVCPEHLLTVARARAGNVGSAPPPRKNGKGHSKRSLDAESRPEKTLDSQSADNAGTPTDSELWSAETAEQVNK